MGRLLIASTALLAFVAAALVRLIFMKSEASLCLEIHLDEKHSRQLDRPKRAKVCGPFAEHRMTDGQSSILESPLDIEALALEFG